MTNFTRVDSILSHMPVDTPIEILSSIRIMENGDFPNTEITKWVSEDNGEVKLAILFQEGPEVSFPYFLNTTLAELEKLATGAYNGLQGINITSCDMIEQTDGWKMNTINYRKIDAITPPSAYTIKREENTSAATVSTVHGDAMMVIVPGASALMLRDEIPSEALWSLLEECVRIAYTEKMAFTLQAMNPTWAEEIENRGGWQPVTITIHKALV